MFLVGISILFNTKISSAKTKNKSEYYKIVDVFDAFFPWVDLHLVRKMAKLMLLTLDAYSGHLNPDVIEKPKKIIKCIFSHLWQVSLTIAP